MNRIIYVAQNQVTSESQYLFSLEEVKSYLLKQVTKKVVSMRVCPYQPWMLNTDAYPMSKNSKEFVDTAMSHFTNNIFGELHLQLTQGKKQGMLSITAKVLEPPKSSFKNLYSENYNSRETNLIQQSSTKGLYVNVTTNSDHIHGYFSNKKDQSFHFTIYHDGKESTIKLLSAKIKSIINLNKFPKTWFVSNEDQEFRVPIVFNAKNIKKLDAWINQN